MLGKNILKASYHKSIQGTYEAPEYTAQLRSDKINLVFHHIFNPNAPINLRS